MVTAEQLRAALEADDGERLLRLCRQLDTNLTVTACGFEYPPHTREMSVTHHIASKPYGLDCLKVLIDKFGSACLRCREEFNYTPVHLAAAKQSHESLELIHRTLGSDCFLERGKLNRTVVHCAAMNRHSNSALKFLIGELGSDSLMEKDDNGSTVVHLAAAFQSSDSMQLMKSKLGSDCFRQRGLCGRTAVHSAACNKISNSALKWLIGELGSDSLMEKDDDGLMACHLVACFQGDESMDLMKGLLGVEVFRRSDRFGRTAVHFAAQNSSSISTLTWWIKELSPECLSLKDSNENTPVHMAAQHQDEKSMQLAVSSLGPDCLTLPGEKQRTAVHFAAMNFNTNSALRWIVGQLGADCLKLRDAEGSMALHLAAQHQAVESLRLIKDSLGVAAFDLKDENGLSVTDYAKKNSQADRMLGCITELQETKRLRLAMENCGMQQISAARQLEETSLDPSFSSWTFLPDAAGNRQLIGEGGFGKVYKAFTNRQQTVAVKIVEPICCRDPSKLEMAVEQERRGFEILRRIRHRSIVQFLKAEPSEHGFCIFTELIAGYSLLDLMERLKKPFDESAVRNFSHQICKALHFLHCEQQRPIVHRDIKCSNIMLTHEGAIKLVDFGLAKEIVSAAKGHTTYTMVTVHFMAAELLLFDDENGRLVYTPKTDVWAFGCTVFEMLEMKPPNSDAHPMQIVHRMTSKDMPQLPDGSSENLTDFYRCCVVKDPGERADTAELLRHSFLQS